MPHRKPQWQPIAILPALATALEGQLESTQAQVLSLEKCLNQPHVLDNETIDHVKAVFKEQQTFVPIYREQLKRWETEVSTDTQSKELERLMPLVDLWEKAVDKVLRLADELSTGTIDSILSMSDSDLGMAFLTGRIKLPRQ